jgi:sugar phosphate isomerase/epimerase
LHPRISLSELSSIAWSIDEDLAFYRAHGVTAIGAAIIKLDQTGLDAGADRIGAAGLRVTNLIGPGPFTLADPTGWDTQRLRLRALIDAAARLHAECLVVTTGPAVPLTWEEAADRLEEAMAPVLAEAAGRGVPMALEHSNPLRVDLGFLHTLRDAVDVARRLGLGVCVELNACWSERGLAATLRDAVDEIRLVQVSDTAVGILSTPNRLVPGDGDVPLARILADVLEAGYQGPFDLELIGPRIDEEGYEHACPRAISALDALLTDLGA